MPNTEMFKQGYKAQATDENFSEAVQAAVDYRGDTTIVLKDGTNLEGFLFNATESFMEFFPPEATEKKTVQTSEVLEVLFSGKDEAAGKGWDDWVKKKEASKTQKANSN